MKDYNRYPPAGPPIWAVAIIIGIVIGLGVKLADAAFWTQAQKRNRSVICKVFGPHCRDALRVSRCESGFSIHAANGQYRGLFQMGESERRLFGHSWTSPWVQARAAKRYFVLSGRDWSPWTCKP